MLTYILFLVGFVMLIKGADLLVEGASSISHKVGISPLVIGLTVVSFGTSAPELVVNVIAGFTGASDIGIGNVLGSNIANILLILGVAAAIHEMKMNDGLIKREVPFSLLAVAVLVFTANDTWFAGRTFNELDLIDGFVFLSFFAIFIYFMATAKTGVFEDKPDLKKITIPKSILYVAVGIAGLALGGKWIVDGAVQIARIFNVSENLIGLTIVAVGTSLPELATSAVAAFKKQADIAIGNVVGSNIFNIFFILGVSAIINPIPFRPAVNNLDIFMVVIATLFLFFAISVGKKTIIQKWNGYSFIGLYIAYVVFLIWRG